MKRPTRLKRDARSPVDGDSVISNPTLTPRSTVALEPRRAAEEGGVSAAAANRTSHRLLMADAPSNCPKRAKDLRRGRSRSITQHPPSLCSCCSNRSPRQRGRPLTDRHGACIAPCGHSTFPPDALRLASLLLLFLWGDHPISYLTHGHPSKGPCYCQRTCHSQHLLTFRFYRS